MLSPAASLAQKLIAQSDRSAESPPVVTSAVRSAAAWSAAPWSAATAWSAGTAIVMTTIGSMTTIGTVTAIGFMPTRLAAPRLPSRTAMSVGETTGMLVAMLAIVSVMVAPEAVVMMPTLDRHPAATAVDAKSGVPPEVEPEIVVIVVIDAAAVVVPVVDVDGIDHDYRRRRNGLANDHARSAAAQGQNCCTEAQQQDRCLFHTLSVSNGSILNLSRLAVALPKAQRYRQSNLMPG